MNTKWIECADEKPQERICVIGNTGSMVWNSCYFGHASLMVGATDDEKAQKRPSEKLWRTTNNDMPLPFRVMRWKPLPPDPKPPRHSKHDALILQDEYNTRIY